MRRGMDYISFGSSIVAPSTAIFLIYWDESFLDHEPEILCVNFTPGTVFQLQDPEFILLSKFLHFLESNLYTNRIQLVESLAFLHLMLANVSLYFQAQ